MNEIICYTTYLPNGTEQNISFLDLLLNENLANGNIECPEEVYAEVGDINHKLSAKQNYEFLLRAIQKYSLKAVGVSAETTYSVSLLPPNSQHLWNSYFADCYIIGKYQEELRSSGYFDAAMKALTESILQLSDFKKAIDFLEKMLSHAPAYYAIDDDTQPILLLRSSNICYNVLSSFIDELAKSLRSCRQRVQIIDDNGNNFPSLIPFIGSHCKAMVCIQSDIISRLFSNCDFITCPKFILWLDHPIGMISHIENVPNSYYLLLHDRNYISFARNYFKTVKKCFYFPPAGVHPQTPLCPWVQKEFDITFIGTFHDYRALLSCIRNLNRPYRFMAARYIHILRHDPDCPAETAFQQMLEYYDISPCAEDFLTLFHTLNLVPLCMSSYFREKIIRTLLNDGIKIHAYGDSWQDAPFAQHKNLILHGTLPFQDTLPVMQQSKISLNIMTWHKDGLTERILNAMLCRSAVLSTKSTRLEEEFIDNEDIILFDLTQIEILPKRIKELLSDDEKLQNIAENGYRKAARKHLWIHRAQQLLRIINHLADE